MRHSIVTRPVVAKALEENLIIDDCVKPVKIDGVRPGAEIWRICAGSHAAGINR